MMKAGISRILVVDDDGDVRDVLDVFNELRLWLDDNNANQ
jgi:hypothetical protein